MVHWRGLWGQVSPVADGLGGPPLRTDLPARVLAVLARNAHAFRVRAATICRPRSAGLRAD